MPAKLCMKAASMTARGAECTQLRSQRKEKATSSRRAVTSAGSSCAPESAPYWMKARPTTIKKVVAENRKARFNYEIIDTYEAGLVLTGTEVKSLREGKANIAESYASDEGGEIWLINSYLPEYLQANRFNHETRRRRKLLLSKREIHRLRVAINREGMTLVPLKVYFNDVGRAKLELALAKGKKLHDKRETEMERDWNRQKGRLLRERG